MSTHHTPVRVGILGFGFMGSTHARAYQRAQSDGYPCQVVAIADRSDRASKPRCNDVRVDLEHVRCCSDPEEILSSDQIDLVSVCTHTDSHVDLAIRALQAGKHVLVEKPVSLAVEPIEKLAAVASESGLVCMPAMCMRFWPAWVWIREMIQSQQFGPVHSADFQRLGSAPSWASSFYSDTARSGGVLHDLHIHDTDFILSLFGMPNAVTTIGDDLRVGTHYHYDAIPFVYAQAGWDLEPGAGFRMGCTIACRDATISFDLNREQPLIVHSGNHSESVEVGELDGYDGQIRAMVDQLVGKPIPEIVRIEDAVAATRVLEHELLSMRSAQTSLLDH